MTRAHHKIHVGADQARLFGATPADDARLGALDPLLDLCTDGAVSIMADVDMGQDHLTMPAPVASLQPRPQVLASGHEVSLWPALTGQTPPVFLPTTAAIAGLLRLIPDLDGVICLATHMTFWIRVSAREICHAQGDLTRSMITAPVPATLERDAFLAGFDTTLNRSSRLGAELAAQQAAQVLGAGDRGPDYRLGLALGAEFATAKAYWLGQEVTVIAEPLLAEAYGLALNHTGGRASVLPLSQAVFSGMDQHRAL